MHTRDGNGNKLSHGFTDEGSTTRRAHTLIVSVNSSSDATEGLNATRSGSYAHELVTFQFPGSTLTT